MSRPVARKCIAPGTTVAPGEVLVATEIGDPARGLAPCPAAPLVAGVLRRRGVRVRFGAVPHFAEASQADDGAVLFVTSALQRDSEATGIGAAAAAVDAVATAAARAAVEQWSAVVATRRLLRAPIPWCDGARQAMERAEKAVAAGPVYVYGHLAGSPQALAGLAEAGAHFTNTLQDIPNGATVLIPAHGVAQPVLDEAAERGLTLIDATCPLVSALQREVQRFAARGDDVIVIGPAAHPVAAGLAGHAGNRTVAAQTPADVGGVVANPRSVSYVLQPGIPVEDTAAVSTALRSRFPALRGPDPDGFCYAASDRAGSVRAVAGACDAVLVLGADNDADTRWLAGLVRASGAKAHVVADLGAIVPDWLAGVAAIGLAQSTSAPPALADEVTAALAGLGQLSVTRRQVTTELAGPSRRE